MSLPVAPAAQIVLEREARRHGFPFDREHLRSRLRYRLVFDVPVHDESRSAVIEFQVGRSDDHPRVTIDGPECLRHRYADDSLCMWWLTDGAERRWTVRDGLLGLVMHIKVHSYCEAECRAGRPWPKAEGPGRHPRPQTCASCQGRGA